MSNNVSGKDLNPQIEGNYDNSCWWRECSSIYTKCLSEKIIPEYILAYNK